MSLRNHLCTFDHAFVYLSPMVYVSGIVLRKMEHFIEGALMFERSLRHNRILDRNDTKPDPKAHGCDINCFHLSTNQKYITICVGTMGHY